MLVVNDVGEGAWEEIDLVPGGGDYGWPCREGAHPNLTTGKCSPTPTNMIDPFFEYPHGTIPGTTAGGCGSITGGAWVPVGLWPSAYDGTYLFADFDCGAIPRLAANGSAASDFATGLGTFTLVELAFGPSPVGTSLYYTTYASGGQVRRIDGPYMSSATMFTPVTPCRVVDTRGPAGPTGGPALQANGSRDFPLTGAPCGVPADAVAVAANVTVTGATTAGSVRIGRAGTTPTLDTVSFVAGQTRANNATLGLFGSPAGSVTALSGIRSRGRFTSSSTSRATTADGENGARKLPTPVRARPLLLTAGVLLVSLADLCLRGRGAVGVVDTNLSIPLASSGARIADRVRPTVPGRAIDLAFSSNEKPPSGARIETALASAGRTRVLLIRSGHPAPAVSAALRDVLSGHASLRIVSDGGWVDLGLAGDGHLEVQILGLLPGPFGLEAPLDQKAGAHGDLTLALRTQGTEPPVRPRWRLVVPQPVPPGEALGRVFFFVRHSAVLAAAGVFALGLLAAGAGLLFAGRPWGATVALVSSATLFHAALLPPFQGADETSHAATVEALVFRGASPHEAEPYPRSFSIAAGALQQDRVQFQPGEPLPLVDAVARNRLAAVLTSSLASEALEAGPEPLAAGLQPADRRAALFFRAYGPAAPLLSRLSFLHPLSAFRLIASAWGLLLFAGGSLLLRRAGASSQVAAFYGLVALIPYSVSTVGTCSNYAPAIGLGQLLAAAAFTTILTSEAKTRRLAAAVFVAGAWAGVLLWTDFVFPALLGTLVLASVVGAWLVARAGVPQRTAKFLAGAAVLLFGAFGGGALFRAAMRGAFAVQVPQNLGAVGPKTMAFIALLALAPLAAAAAAGLAVRRLAAKPEAEGVNILASCSIALASLTTCAFLLTRWTAVPFGYEYVPFPRLVAEHARAFLSNAFAWDQDRLSWKFWLGAFGWHDAFYPDAIYALARWGFVVLLVSFPLLAAPFLRKRPASASALFLVSGSALGCGTLTFTLRYLAPTVPYGRFVLPLAALAAFPLLVMLEADSRERWGRTALLAAAAFQVWTAIVVLGARYAYGG